MCHWSEYQAKGPPEGTRMLLGKGSLATLVLDLVALDEDWEGCRGTRLMAYNVQPDDPLMLEGDAGGDGPSPINGG